MMITSGSANDRTCAVRDTAQGSKNHTISGAIKEMFREAVKAITGPEAEETPRRRQRGDTERGFQMVAKAVVRRTAQLPQEAYVAAISFLSDARDWLSVWDNEFASGEQLHNETENADSNHLFPHI
jgi:hypothetical protein